MKVKNAMNNYPATASFYRGRMLYSIRKAHARS